jgi:DNA polymerase III delta prime subunit
MTTEQLFINKYQPLYFKDFGENNEIIKMLQTLIKIDDLNILLFGDMASGKTSLLNALIKEYYVGFNSKDYQENILYINNLKEQGINYYRTDVKTFCQTCSNIKGKKKFLMLDDIDFINEQSQQVFRNFIDKYSHNVNFIASCSNNQKVIESLQSRLTIIKIKPLQNDDLIEIINNVIQNENILLDEDVKQFIINISNNTVKVIINYLEKFKLLNQKIDLPLAIKLCCNISFVTFEKYTQLLLNGDLSSSIQLIFQLIEKGYSVMDILDNYFMFVKMTNILSEEDKYKIIPYLCKYITIFHNIHEDEIELALFTNNLIKIFTPLKI